MGLDQYAYRCNPAKLGDAKVDFDKPEESTEFFYWRKHPNIQGWMENLYRRRGGKEDSFNCVPVRLTESDLNELEFDIRRSNLPRTSGFFFGQSSGDDAEIDEDLEFVRKARNAIAEGDTIFYTSWW